MKHRHLFQWGLLVASLALTMDLRSQDLKTLPSLTITPTTNVSDAVDKSFSESFPDGQKAAWYNSDKDYLVKSITKEQNNRDLYKNKESLVYELRYGQESNLPDEVRNQVKSAFQDYQIKSVLLVNQGERKFWLINLDDNRKLIVARVENGAMEQVEGITNMN